MSDIYNNDTYIFFLTGIFVFLSIILLNTGKSTCISKYIAYGIFFLPGTYLLVSLIAIGTFLPEEISYISLMFSIFYILYLVAFAVPLIIMDKLGMELFITNNFAEYSEVLEFVSCVMIWTILLSIFGYIICKKSRIK